MGLVTCSGLAIFRRAPIGFRSPRAGGGWRTPRARGINVKGTHGEPPEPESSLVWAGGPLSNRLDDNKNSVPWKTHQISIISGEDSSLFTRCYPRRADGGAFVKPNPGRTKFLHTRMAHSSGLIKVKKKRGRRKKIRLSDWIPLPRKGISMD